MVCVVRDTLLMFRYDMIPMQSSGIHEQVPYKKNYETVTLYTHFAYMTDRTAI